MKTKQTPAQTRSDELVRLRHLVDELAAKGERQERTIQKLRAALLEQSAELGREERR